MDGQHQSAVGRTPEPQGALVALALREHPRASRESLLVTLERWVVGHGRLPHPDELTSASCADIEARFGSWRAAMRQVTSTLALHHRA
jgi:hypothetical protein